MKEYMTALGVILMLISFSNMLIPEGSIKKYTSLAMGFILICSALSFIPDGENASFFDIKPISFSEEEIKSGEALYKSEVIKKHRENLENTVKERLKHGGRVSVEVTEEGEVSSVTMWIRGDESGAIGYIVENFGITREDIKLKYDKT